MPDRSSIRIALLQHACPVDRTPAENLAAAEQMLREAAASGADLAVTQEMFNTIYFPQTEDNAHFALAESIPGPTSQRLCELAAELQIEIIGSLFEKRAPGVFHNTSIVISAAGEIIGKYRKMHIPDDPGFYEKFYFSPGDLGFQSHALRQAKVGTLICWDQWFPEAARATVLRGAEVLVYPTAIGWIPNEPLEEQTRQRLAWTTIQRSHAIANGVFVCSVNRVGTEGDITFWGSSMAIDPGGQIIAQASEDAEEILIVECDLSLIDQHRQTWPFLRDRRIDAYRELLSRFVDENDGNERQDVKNRNETPKFKQ